MARFLLALVALLMLASNQAAALTGNQVVDSIRVLTSKSHDLQAPAQSITIINGPLIIIGQGPFPQIIAGFTEIITLLANDISGMEGGSRAPLNATDSEKVSDAFREFVRVHQTLLNILIGKAGLFSTIPFIGQPVAQVLRSLEAVLDTFAFGLIDTCESQADNLKDQTNSLDTTLANCINAYESLTPQWETRKMLSVTN